jgi:hypothetical protein
MLKYFDQKALYSPSKVLELVTPCFVSSTQQSFEIASNFSPFFIFVQATEIHGEKETNKTTAKIAWAQRKIGLVEGNSNVVI